MDERVWHYVRPNETTRIPRRHIFLDTESKNARTKTGHRQSWRLGAAAYRLAEKGRPSRDTLRTYRDPHSLWADVSEFTRSRNRTILWAHHLGFDVRIADAFRALPALGWRVDAHNLASRGTWINWQRNGATLLMVDSTSVFPDTLATLAKSFMQAKVRLPDANAPDDEWMERCIRDVEILRAFVVSYLEWIEAEDLGNWQMTGAGQSYAAFRHRHLTHKMLVHAATDVLEAEREAMWTGRCEAYWKGNTGHVGIEEWDLSLAYPRLARAHNLPTQLVGPLPASQDVLNLLGRTRTAILARVEVETEQPVVPCKVDGRMAWPVGRFETTLWDPELRLAIETGARVRVLEAWKYVADPALRQWADWIIQGLDPANPHITAWQRRILKHWARALIGRFGMQYTKWETFGRTDNHDVKVTTVYDVQTGEEFELTHLGDAVMRADGTTEWAQSMPAITGYVMSLSRVWLWKLIQAMPPNSVLYADTDSMYVRAEHHDAAVALSRTPLGEGLRLKDSYTRARILGPRQVIVDGRARIAGLPKSSTPMPDGSFKGEVWSSLADSLRRGDAAGVITTDRSWKVTGKDYRRVGGRTGWTEPIRVGGE